MQINLPKLGIVNKILICCAGGIFLAQSIFSKMGLVDLQSYLGLSIGMALKGNIISLLTYPFVGSGFFDVLINCIMLWFIGGELEELWGKKRYTRFVLSSIIGGGILFLLIGLFFFSADSQLYFFPLLGLSGLVSALCVGYGVLFPNRIFTFMLLFPMKAKYFCMLLVGISLYSGIFTPLAVQAWGHLGTIGAGFIFMWAVSQKFAGISLKGSHNLKKKKRHLSIVTPEENEDDTPKYWH